MVLIRSILPVIFSAVISFCLVAVVASPADAVYPPAERDASIHVVGLYEAGPQQHFRMIAPWGADIDWLILCSLLVEQGQKDHPNPARRIWSQLSAEARNVVTDMELVGRIHAFSQNRQIPPRDPEVIRALHKIRGGMEDVLRKADIYEEKSFAGVAVDDETKQLIKNRQKLHPLETCVLNRRLLEASFPNAIKKSTFSLAKATVPVRVIATKEPIVLVLCSYESVRWDIQAEKGANIKMVIVGGYHMQAVVGTNAPVAYRVYEDHEKGQATPRYFFAYKKDDERYANLVQAVRHETGADVTTFQGRYSYERGTPIVVGSKE